MTGDLGESIEEIRKRTFRIVTTCGDSVRHGTGFMIARLVPSQRIVIATAKHVLEFPEDAHVRWRFERLAEDGQITGECRFTVDEADVATRPHRYYKYADIGFCVVPPPEQQSAGQLVEANLAPLRCIAEDRRLCPGTRVAWAGYPGSVESFLRRPQLCYFEGSVSAFYSEGSRGLYIVDGHNAFGVSGGPVWYKDDKSGEIMIAGIVSGYCQHDKLPGFCVFEPINPVVTFVKVSYKGQPIVA